MGIAIANIRFEVAAKSTGFPGFWAIQVTNISSLATSYVPVSVMVESDTVDLDSLIFTAEGDPHLQPGESLSYLLKLTREGFEDGKGWKQEDLGPNAKLLLVIQNFGLGGGVEPMFLRLPALESKVVAIGSDHP